MLSETNKIGQFGEQEKIKCLFCLVGGQGIEISEDIVRPRTVVLFSLRLNHVGPSQIFQIMQNNGANEQGLY